MKFMSGMQLDKPSPQPLREILKDTQLTRSLPDHGFAQTAYPVYIFYFKVDILTQFYAEHSKPLTNFSYLIKNGKKSKSPQVGSPT